MREKERLLAAFGDRIGATVDKKGRFYFEVAPSDIRSVAGWLIRELGCRLSTATAQEDLDGMEVQYHFSHDSSGAFFCPRVVLRDPERLVTPSIATLCRGAEWIEREMAEYWGITFEGHPRPEPLLTRNHPDGTGLGQPFRIRRTP